MRGEEGPSDAPRALPDYDIVIVHYKNSRIYSLLESINKLEVSPARVVVADNSGDFDTGRVARRHDIPIDVLRLDNPGYASAINRAAETIESPSKFLLVLTHEVKIFPGAVSRLLEAALESPRYGLIGPLLVDNEEGTRVYSAGGRYLTGARPKHLSAGDLQAGRRPDYVDGAVMLIQRDVFEKIGGLDEKYFLYYEDNDICQRVRLAGYDIHLAPAARFGQQTGNFTHYYQTRNQILFSRAYSSFSELWLHCAVKWGARPEPRFAGEIVIRS
ncbi:glycosyltransferase [Gordonia rubripertincta]|uniref:glycosyltransferase n=1 Tax=Gordonia rubripertincta TaxID=36822 RepID=UPI0039B525A0